MLQLADRLLNHTEENVYLNPIDIATVIDLLGLLVKTQVSSTQNNRLVELYVPSHVFMKQIGFFKAKTMESEGNCDIFRVGSNFNNREYNIILRKRKQRRNGGVMELKKREVR